MKLIGQLTQSGTEMLADTLKTTVQTKTVDNLDSKTERKRFKNRNFD